MPSIPLSILLVKITPVIALVAITKTPGEKRNKGDGWFALFVSPGPVKIIIQQAYVVAITTCDLLDDSQR